MKTFVILSALLAVSSASANSKVSLDLRTSSCDTWLGTQCKETSKRICESAEMNAKARLAAVAKDNKDIDATASTARTRLKQFNTMWCDRDRYTYLDNCYVTEHLTCSLEVNLVSTNYKLVTQDWSKKGREDVCKPAIDEVMADPAVIFQTFSKHIARNRFDTPSQCSGTYVAVEKAE